MDLGGYFGSKSLSRLERGFQARCRYPNGDYIHLNAFQTCARLMAEAALICQSKVFYEKALQRKL
jgi:hypothetical protein